MVSFYEQRNFSQKELLLLKLNYICARNYKISFQLAKYVQSKEKSKNSES